MRLLSWNINGLRPAVRKFGGIENLLNSLQADVVCFQETKLRKEDLDRDLAVVVGWESFFSFNRSKSGGWGGYSGVATFCRRSVTVPSHAEEGFTGVLSVPRERVSRWVPPPPWDGSTAESLLALDSEGRCVLTDHGAFVLLNVYGPAITNESNAEERFRFKMEFYEALEVRMRQLLGAGRAVLLVGDLNISPQPLDSCEPGPLAEFMARRDRRWLHALLAAQGGPFMDVFRMFHPDRTEAFTCWSTASGARVNNYGTRIDLILAGSYQKAEEGGPHAGMPAVATWVQSADIWPELEGSDHAPVYADLAPPEPLEANTPPPPFSTTFMFSGRQVSLRTWLSAAAAPGAATQPASQTSSAQAAAREACAQPPGSSQGITAQAAGGDVAILACPAAAQQHGAAAGAPHRGGAAGLATMSWDTTSKANGADPRTAGSSLDRTAGSSRASQSSATGKRKDTRSSAPAPAQQSLLAFFGRSKSGAGTSASSAPAQHQHDCLANTNTARQRSGASIGSGPAPHQDAWLANTSTASRWSGAGTSSAPAQHQVAWVANTSTASQSGAGTSSAPAQQRDAWLTNTSTATHRSSTGTGLAPAQHHDAWWANTSTASQRSGEGILRNAPLDRPGSSGGTAAHTEWSGSGGVMDPPCSCAPSTSAFPTSEQYNQAGACAAVAGGVPGPAWSCLQAAGEPPASTSLGLHIGQPSPRGQSASQERWPVAATNHERLTTNADPTAVHAMPSAAPAPPHAGPPRLTPAYPASQPDPEVDIQPQPPQADTRGDAPEHGSPPDGMLPGTDLHPTSPSGSADDPAPAHSAWQRIQQRMRPPRCAVHDEECVIRVVKKKGSNNGRVFYVCRRPDGPPPIGRCDFFMWANRREYRGQMQGQAQAEGNVKRRRL